MSRAEQQLQVLLKIESDKEQQLAQELQSAQSYLTANEQKLKEVEGYKLEYLGQLQTMGNQGVIGGNYQHYQRFIVQLEQGIKQQLEVLETAKLVVKQRRELWLKQREKVQAAQLLIDKKQFKKQLDMAKAEQAMADEFASQKFIRSRV